jgi:hypothetical protein
LEVHRGEIRRDAIGKQGAFILCTMMREVRWRNRSIG